MCSLPRWTFILIIFGHELSVSGTMHRSLERSPKFDTLKGASVFQDVWSFGQRAREKRRLSLAREEIITGFQNGFLMCFSLFCFVFSIHLPQLPILAGRDRPSWLPTLNCWDLQWPVCSEAWGLSSSSPSSGRGTSGNHPTF